MQATIQDEARIKNAGYKVQKWGPGWILTDPDGHSLFIGDHGGVSPTRWEAVAEGLRRIDADTECEARFRATLEGEAV